MLDFQSYECESPDLNEERDRYKRLKQKFKASSKQLSLDITEKIEADKIS